MKKMLKKRLNQKGLTLIELLAVIVILAIVAAIAIPAIGNIIDNSRYSAIKSDAINALNAAQIYFAENSGEPTVKVSDLQDKGYLETIGTLDGNNTTITQVPNGENKISGTGTKGSISITFKDATISQINDAEKNAATIGSGN